MTTMYILSFIIQLKRISHLLLTRQSSHTFNPLTAKGKTNEGLPTEEPTTNIWDQQCWQANRLSIESTEGVH